MNVVLGDNTIAVYLEHLTGYPLDKLNYAINRTIQEWPEASKMPPLNFILSRCADYSSERNARSNVLELMDRADKPPGWEPIEPGEAAAMLNEIKTALREANPRGPKQW